MKRVNVNVDLMQMSVIIKKAGMKGNSGGNARN